MRSNSRFKIYTVIFVLFFLEAAVSNRLRICFASPGFLLIAVIFFGFHFGMARGAETGLVAGILRDVFCLTNFGVNTFSFLLIGALAGYLRKKLDRENFITEFFISAGAVFISGISFFELPRFAINSAGGFWLIIFYKSLYTGLVAPPLFLILRKIFGPKGTTRI